MESEGLRGAVLIIKNEEIITTHRIVCSKGDGHTIVDEGK